MNSERQKYQSLAFSKHTPTAFIIESPFQLLCAWNAIADFEIEDYRIVLVLERSNIRNQQVFDMLQSRDMSYDVCYTDEYGLADIIRGRISKSDVLFDRVMIGEILYMHHLAIAGLYASADSVVVYMDDGAASIRVLSGHSFNESRIKALVKNMVRHKVNIMLSSIKQYWRTKGIHDYGFYYTIYSDIPTHKFITYPNKMNKLRQSKTSISDEKAVLIIGAATNDYAVVANVSVPEYEGILWRKMREVRNAHPDSRIIYIPHGRDNNKAIEYFCKILDVEYRRLSMTIEQYVIDTDLIFTHVYGFASTAHYTLKLITNAQVTDWIIRNKQNPAWYSISEISAYYKKHGIFIDTISYPTPSCKQYIRYYVQSILNMLKRN